MLYILNVNILYTSERMKETEIEKERVRMSRCFSPLLSQLPCLWQLKYKNSNKLTFQKKLYIDNKGDSQQAAGSRQLPECLLEKIFACEY